MSRPTSKNVIVSIVLMFFLFSAMAWGLYIKDLRIEQQERTIQEYRARMMSLREALILLYPEVKFPADEDGHMESDNGP